MKGNIYPRTCSHCGKPSNKSGYHGVLKMKGKRRNYFAARLSGKYLGSFETAKDAAHRYDEEVRKRDLDKALNFPRGDSA